MSDEGTIVQKQGEIVAVQPTKTGWTEIHLQEQGKQYPYKASTKLEAIIEQAQAALFKEAVLTAKEVDSGNPNPNRPGYNYINRTAMKVEVGGTIPPPQSEAAPSAAAQVLHPAPTHAPLPPGDKDRAITRMAVLKAAAAVVASPDFMRGGGDHGAEVIALAARFETWVYRDTDAFPFE